MSEDERYKNATGREFFLAIGGCELEVRHEGRPEEESFWRAAALMLADRLTWKQNELLDALRPLVLAVRGMPEPEKGPGQDRSVDIGPHPLSRAVLETKTCQYCGERLTEKKPGTFSVLGYEASDFHHFECRTKARR